eukprot:CAMPEP_0194279148 /NCGR_PEP_ID=MMETSP0169-20130528/13463_1 /TAXON_ID=218684 /ORGANISM="Corethron pennatum, Strain L29A3" /LENGTH=276 /DNA_ID=CAMNT_0039023521 /DNA_START=110 /DNA_END=936 /DNA_ORIENTATION=-
MSSLESRECQEHLLESNNIFTDLLEDKVNKLVTYIKNFQNVVKDTEIKVAQSKEKIAELTVELATAEKEKEAAITSVSSLEAHSESEKKSSKAKIQVKADEMEGLGNDFKTNLEGLKMKGMESITALGLKIAGLIEELKESQNECTKSNNLCGELRKKITALQNELKIETDVHKVVELVYAQEISKKETEMSKKLTDLSISKEKELSESEAHFQKLKDLYVTQKTVLGEREEAIAAYKIERGSLPKIVKLGLNVAGEATKESARAVSGRGRSLARG